MLNYIKLFSLFLVAVVASLSFSNDAKATHALGGELTYECIGDNTYRLRLTFYRDCAGAVAIGNIDTEVKIRSSCFNTNIDLTLQSPPQYGAPFDQFLEDYEIPIYCEASNCGNGNLPGIQELVYEGIIELPPCEDYLISYVEYARSDAINTLVGPGQDSIRVEAFLNNQFAPCNSSPQFDVPARGIICLNQPNTMIHTATDFDGDLLVYSLYAPLHGPNIPVTYQPGYSFTDPINNSNFDFNNGILDVTPTEQAITVIGVLVEEYRDGILIGSVMRDFQVTVVSQCPQNPDGFFESDTIVGFDADSIVVCTNDTISFDVVLGNTLQGQNYFLEVGNLSDFPGATFEVLPDPQVPGSVFGQFSWAPNLSNVNSQSLIFQAYDDNCPVVGFTNFTYTFYFENIVLDATVDEIGVACNDSSLLTVTLDDPNGFVVYEWQDGSTDPSYWAGPGEYSVTVTDSLGCTGSDGFEVYYNNAPVAEFTAPNICVGEEMLVNDQSFNFAEQGVTPLDLTDWSWDFGDNSGSSTDTAPSYTYTAPGTYEISLFLTNENDCIDTAQYEVVVYPLPQLLASADVACIGNETQFNNNSQIQSGSLTDWSWDFGDAGATSTEPAPEYTYSEVGTYDVTLSATSDQGCEGDTSFTALVTPEATAGFSYEANPNCGEENLLIFFENESENATAYLWDFVTSTDTAANPVYSTPDAYGPIVTLVAYAAAGEAACSDTVVDSLDDVFLIVDFDTINAGNIITPNADGFNDCLSPFWDEGYEECYRLRIWDRWGMFIYDSDDITDGYCWPGTDRNGQPVSSGTYFFVAEVNSYSRAGNVYVNQ